MMLESILLIVVSAAILVALRPPRRYTALDGASGDPYEPAMAPPAAGQAGRPATPTPLPRGSSMPPPLGSLDIGGGGDGESPRAVRRTYELRDRGEALPVIAAILNAEGHRTIDGTEFTPIHVWQMLRRRRHHARAARQPDCDRVRPSDVTIQSGPQRSPEPRPADNDARQRPLRSIGKIGGEAPARIVPSTSNPCRS